MVMSFWFDDQQDEQADDQQEKKEDDFAFSGFALISRRHRQFFVGRFDVDGHAFDVVVDPVQHRSLVYHHRLEFFEDVR